MKYFKILTVSLFFLFISSCSNSNDAKLNERLNNLEQQIDSLSHALADQKTKTRMAFIQIASNPLFNTPWEDFLLASDDFWNQVVDVGLSECSGRCSKIYKAAKKECDSLPDGQEKLDCINSALKNSQNCQQNCLKEFPPN